MKERMRLRINLLKLFDSLYVRVNDLCAYLYLVLKSLPFFPFYGAKLQNIIANMSLANYICTLNNVDIPKPGHVGSVQQDWKTY